MQLTWKSVWAALVISSGIVIAGCGKGGDSSQPAAAVPGPGGEKAAGAAPAPAAESKSEQDMLHPIFEVETSQGKFTMRLDAASAPFTVENFRNYVARNHYDQTIFHEVLKGTVKAVLGGGYTADLKEKKAYTPVRNEAHNGLKNRRGAVAMARRADDVDSATCQFFVNLADNEVLDFKARTPEGYGYCVFGQVTEGLDVLERIAQLPVKDTDKFQGTPVEAVVIKTIRQIR